MLWKYNDDHLWWTCSVYRIELHGSTYELWQVVDTPEGPRMLIVRGFTDLRAAKHYAKGDAYTSGAITGRKRGRPSSAARCPDCGAPPSKQTKTTTPV
jgi:hypothetical protein